MSLQEEAFSHLGGISSLRNTETIMKGEGIMAFGPIMQFTVPKSKLRIEMAPLTSESVQECINPAHGGGMQRLSVTRYLGMSTAPVAEDEQEWFDKVRKDSRKLIWGIWVLEKGSRILIGVSSLGDIGQHGHAGFVRQATSGSQIFRPEYWGKGIASTAHKARLLYAFTHLGLHRIKSAVIQENGGSSTALKRVGYTYVYTERNEQFSDGALRHLDCYECLNPLDLFWQQWWHGDEPPKEALKARNLARASLDWAEEHVTFP